MSKFVDCYFRVSTQEQTKGQSLDTQQEYGQKISNKLGLNFRPRNEGAKSSTRGFRPQLEEIKEDIEKGLIKGKDKKLDGHNEKHPANVAAKLEHKMMDIDGEKISPESIAYNLLKVK